VISDAHVELGRHLFYDKRLSGNGTQACASCHEQARAFTDGRRVAEGSTGELTPRNAMALVNVAYNSAFNWANPSLAHLEEQVVIPMFGERPIELGVTGHEAQILERLEADERYQALFALAYPDEEQPISFHNIVGSLSAFTRTLISGESPFDRFVYQGERGVLSASALRGMDLFFSEELECHHCHGGFNFSFSTTHEQREGASLTIAFHNTGLYNLNGTGAAPTGSQGVFEVSGDPQDMGKFRAPTLRNIEVTAPYMHDGSMESLEEVVRFYEAGGRLITEGPHAGDGRDNPLKSEFVSGFTLTDQERADLIEFLRSLTDEAFLSDERFANPWLE
jgi:cytochrome c peroxidase